MPTETFATDFPILVSQMSYFRSLFHDHSRIRQNGARAAHGFLELFSDNQEYQNREKLLHPNHASAYLDDIFSKYHFNGRPITQALFFDGAAGLSAAAAWNVYEEAMAQFTYPPTQNPTNQPTIGTKSPTHSTIAPSQSPTLSPTTRPTLSPSQNPTLSPTFDPTESPTQKPTLSPTPEPTRTPTQNPTLTPTTRPTLSPSQNPTFLPTFNPTLVPSHNPTEIPTPFPTLSPTFIPTPNTPGEHNPHRNANGAGIAAGTIIPLIALSLYIFKRCKNKEHLRDQNSENSSPEEESHIENHYDQIDSNTEERRDSEERGDSEERRNSSEEENNSSSSDEEAKEPTPPPLYLNVIFDGSHNPEEENQENKIAIRSDSIPHEPPPKYSIEPEGAIQLSKFNEIGRG